MPAPTDYTADEKRTKISMSNSEDPFFAADAVAANPSSAATPTNPDGTKKLSKSAMKKLEKQKAMGDKGKQDKSALKAGWGAPKAAGGSKKEKEKAAKAAKTPAFVFTDPTPKGQKKDVSKIDMPDAYHPAYVESSWQQWWEESGFYSCDVEKAKTRPKEEKFVMVIPPPNVTGSLHLGHALTAAVEDTMVRYHRMCGHSTMYVPGTDHAGIATQSVVEKKLKKEKNINRHDLGREEFVKKVWEWKEEFGKKITSQLRFLGSSVDWSREAFTMDENCSKAVTEAFVQFHEKGLLYRARRLGNWSCALKSAISDIEVDHIELTGRTFLAVPNHPGNPSDPAGKYEFGVITSFCYIVEGTGEELTVATTRLETMLGDTAVAVHPDDPRYTHLHGKFCTHPFNGRRIPIVTDSISVNMEFGTGAVKITPAHDPNDYECGKRNDLAFIGMLNEDGSINGEGGDKFTGMMRYDARIAIEDALKELGHFKGKEVNPMSLGLCSRSGDILEPMITPQWYVNCDNMAKRATDAVRNKDLKILPVEHEKTWFNWLDNIRDWCISRQLWWGHRIPAWFATMKGEVNVSKGDMVNNERWIVARNVEDARKKAAAHLQCEEGEIELEQDEDVLDTWFSSGLFPFAVFGWPENTDDMKAFYPTSLLETGSDILFFWVARMVMMGLELTDMLPFETVYLHAMVRDKNGRKMSKSLGNVVDPLEVINGCTLDSLYAKLEGGNLPKKEVERAKKDQAADFPEGIPECGSDALRFGLLAYTVQGRDVNLDIKRVVGYRQFGNKLWNATKFALQFVADFQPEVNMIEVAFNSPALGPRDRYIISKVNDHVRRVNECLAGHEYGLAQQTVYEMWMNEICAVYMELVKPVVYDTSEENSEKRNVAQGTLWACLEIGLRLLHPMMPFITEELWQRLPGRGKLGESETQTIMLAEYPQHLAKYDNSEVEGDMEVAMEAVKACRSLKKQYSIANKEKPTFFLKSSKYERALKNHADDIVTLGGGVVKVNETAPETSAIVVANEDLTVFIDLAGLVDFDKEIAKITKEMEKLTPLINLQNLKMGKDGYDEKVKESVREKDKEKLDGYKVKMDLLKVTAAKYEVLKQK